MKKELSVSELNTLMKALVETDGLFQNIWVHGEVSNCRWYSAKNHLYFTLQDEKAAINCVIYDTEKVKAAQTLEDGQSVQVLGKARWFSKKGTLSFQAHTVIPIGHGKEKQQLAQLKATLEKSGVF
mgnify:CR=1 FL=1